MYIKGLIRVEDRLDSDGELEINAESDFLLWINKTDAIELVKHLIKVFEIENKDLEWAQKYIS